VREQVAANVPEAIARIRAAAKSLPVVVGFGISTRAHVAEIAAFADGVVIGSALVNCIRDNLAQRDRIAPALAAKATDFASGVRR
jgi:tryptophan synthase alpha chain